MFYDWKTYSLGIRKSEFLLFIRLIHKAYFLQQMACFSFSESKRQKAVKPWIQNSNSREIHHLFLGFRMHIFHNSQFCWHCCVFKKNSFFPYKFCVLYLWSVDLLCFLYLKRAKPKQVQVLETPHGGTYLRKKLMCYSIIKTVPPSLIAIVL